MNDDRLWVFGYGSLMWDPGFAHDRAEPARLSGYRRGFLMRSIHHRGTPEAPGLVLALDEAPGAHCDGIAFRVAAGGEDATLAALRERELVSYAYCERVVPVDLADGGQVGALAYVIDRAHRQYVGPLPLEEQAQVIARAHGGRGSNAAYLHNTEAHLRALGVHEPEIAWLDRRVRALQGTEP